MLVKLNNSNKGIICIVIAVFCYALMDGFIKHLSQYYNVITISMFRYWFFAIFILLINSRKDIYIISIPLSKIRYIQILRSTILVFEVCLCHYCFLKIGLIQTSSLFAIGPLIVTALSVIFLKEKVGWKRWTAILLGFIGILIILKPGIKEFEPYGLLALFSAFLYAIYQILTRVVSRYDNTNTTLFYTGVTGAVVLSFIGPFFYVNVKGMDWIFILITCILGLTAHFFIIKAFKFSEASVLQPFNYLHLIFVTIIGIIIFDEVLDTSIVAGATIVVFAGLYTYWRERKLKV